MQTFGADTGGRFLKHKRNDRRGAAKSARRDTHITVFGDSSPKGLYLEDGKVARRDRERGEAEQQHETCRKRDGFDLHSHLL